MARAFSSAQLFEYDVFLSFRQIDTGKTFADHLYHALRQSGVRVFRDSKVLEERKEIGRLFDVIERSRIFVVVFSLNYARSTWCLTENEKIVWVARTGEAGRLILPVFYRIDPTDVCQQTEPFTGAVLEHEKDMGVNDETVKEWREALRKASKFPGYESEKIPDRLEATLVDMIVQRILKELDKAPPNVGEYLVGIKSRANDIIKNLKIDSYDGARMVGIQGVGGLGKTTVAKAVYNKIYRWFESCCFIDSIGGEYSHGTEGLVGLQRKLVSEMSEIGVQNNISNASEGTAILQKILQKKRVLIFLDDVDSIEQIQAMVGKQEWFHPGSRVIITTRDEGVLDALPDWEKHKISMPLIQLDENEALELFSWYAFRENSPADGYEELSLGIVRALHGWPLAIRTVASTLTDNKDSNDWHRILNAMRGLGHSWIYRRLSNNWIYRGLRRDWLYRRLGDYWIYRTLKMSYDRLSSRDQKSIFLDVACFLSGIDQETAIFIWDACGFSSRLSVEALTRKSLIKIVNGKLEMHDTLRELGMHIVLNEPGSGRETRSRLWTQEAMMHVLRLQKGARNIEGISLTYPRRRENGHALRFPINVVDFAWMDSLRLLVINHVDLSGQCKRMPRGIKWLQWQGCPLKFLSSDFYFKEVAAMDLSYSKLTGVQTKQALSSSSAGLGIARWLTGQRKATKTAFRSLKFLDLTACNELTETPNLSVFPGLEKLVLDRCDNLLKVHDSIANPKRLAVLSMSSCGKLKELPDCMSSLASLKRLILANCSSLESLPDRIVQLIALEELDVSNCSSLNKLPDSVLRELTLKKLQIIGFPNLEPVGNPASGIYRLHESNHSTKDQYAMKHLDDRHLKYLYFSGTGIQKLPISISLQKNLHLLHLNNCQLLAEVPEWIADLCLLEELSLSNCPLITGMPHTIASLEYLRYLNLSRCNRIQALPDCIGDLGSLIELLLENVSLMELPESVVFLRKLEILHLGSCKKLERLPSSIGNLENLTQLLLHGTNIKEIPSSITSLQKLELLSVTGCKRLKHLPVGLSEDLLLL
ncbi:disease resistance protein RUN1-like [Nymphaea colorata]|nr:disease resistance protein RUN1-like [Nymphaea colorata]